MRKFKITNFIFPCIIIISTFVITYCEFRIYYGEGIKELGSYNIFVLVAYTQNNLLGLSMPVIPAIIAFKNILVITDMSKYKFRNLAKESIKISIYAAIFILIIYFSSLIILMMIFPQKASVELEFIGFFSEVGTKSLFLYCLTLITHTSILTFVYTQFSYWIILLSNKNYFSVIIPTIYYHTYSYTRWLIKAKASRILGFMFPSMNYKINILEISLWDNSKNIAFTIFLSFVIAIIIKERNKKHEKL